MVDHFILLLVAVVLASSANARFFIQTDKAHVSKEKVIGGHEVDIESYPFEVSIMRSGMHYCGGSIITPRHILTAAHCVEAQKNPRFYRVRSGSADITDGGVITKVSKIITHENYRHREYPEYVAHDIAILVLAKPLTFDEVTQNISLIPRPVEEGEEAYVSGWGLTDRDSRRLSRWLKALRLEVVSDDSCMFSDVSEKKVCAVSGNTDGACNGDSGGPLTVEGYLAGIVSTNPSQECGNFNEVTVFTSVWHHRDWIGEKIGNHLL